MKNNKLLLLYTLLFFCSCTHQQVSQVLDSLGESSTDELTSTDVTGGLKDALVKGITLGAQKASATDGYYKNSLIKIPFPENIVKIKNTLNDIGMSKLVDDFELSLNRAAEKGAKKAAPIFVNAITSMSISDAWSILKGEEHAATNYLKKTTTDDLTLAFNPIIKKSLDESNATKYFNQMVTQYNKIPFIEKMNPNLDEYATTKAIDGLFTLVGQEEEKIRKDPVARTTDLMQKVFNKDNWK